MMDDSPRSMPKILAHCAKLYQRKAVGRFNSADAKAQEDLRNLIKTVWTCLAASELCARPYSIDASLDEKRPGYVVIQVDRLRVFVPFFLVQVFPVGDTLRALCNLGSQLQIGADSVICVSGSACHLRTGLPVGDLDFCEYLSMGDRSLGDRLRNKLVGGPQQPVCYKFELGARKWSRPWQDDLLDYSQQRSNENLQSAMREAGSRQCAFIVEMPGIGVIEATNLVVLLDYSNTESSEAVRSHAAHEAPVTGGNWVPRDLASPIALGAYIISDVDAAWELLGHSASQPRHAVKAIRRAIAVTRILMLAAETNKLESLLKNEGARLAALFDRCELYAAISDSNDTTVRSFRARLRESIDQLRGFSTTDASYYLHLTEAEANELRVFRDQATPELFDVLDTVNSLLGIYLKNEGSAE